MGVTEGVYPSAHGHSACHPIPFTHFEDHVGDPSHDDCDFGFGVADGFEAECEVWKVFLDDGKDGLIGDAISGMPGRSANEPRLDVVKCGVNVSAEGRRDRLGVCLGGACSGRGEGLLPVPEHGVCVMCVAVGRQKCSDSKETIGGAGGCFKVLVSLYRRELT